MTVDMDETDASVAIATKAEMPRTGFHVVQVGYDDTIFSSKATTDLAARQQAYLDELERRAPGSRITILVLTTLPGAKEIRSGALRYLPVPFRKWFQIPWRTFRALRRLHARDRIHLVTTQTLHEEGLGALLFRRKRGIPLVGQVHFDLFSEAGRRENLGAGLRGALRWLLIRKTMGRYDALRVVGKGIANRILASKMNPNVHVAPVFASMLRSTEPPSSPGDTGDRILFVGRLEEQKRMDLWMRVAKQILDLHPEARFDVAGDGSLRAPLEKLAGELGIRDRVVFHGHVPYQALAPLYRAAKVFLLTSSYEGFGRVLVEANFHGVPAVSTRITGAEDIIVDGETGYLLEFGDEKGLARSVVDLLQSPEKRGLLGAAARARAIKEYDPENLIRQWVGIWMGYLTSGIETPTTMLAPKLPTWRRWSTLSTMDHSLLRALEYEALSGVRLEGRILDIGGGEWTSYHRLFDVRGKIETVNIDPSRKPTYVADLNHPLPLPDGCFDAVISMNTWEHIFRDEVAIRESLRLLRSGGRFHFTVPFLFRVHGSPYDYHRHTAFWWSVFLTSLGVDPSSFKIEPLVWDPLSTGLALSNFLHSRLLRKASMLLPLLRRRGAAGDRMAHPEAGEYCLGYYIYGTK